MRRIKRAGITGRFSNSMAIKAAKKAIRIFSRNKAEVFIDENFPVAGDNLCELSSFGKDNRVDAVFSFGGDGTFLRAVRALRKDIPVVGVNCGRLGFLLEMSAAGIGKELPAVIRGGYYLEKRSRLEARIDGKKLPYAMNEVAVVPKLSGRLVKYELHIDDWFSRKEGSDGLIVATPTGSTGHSLSAGGPVMVADARVFVVTSINPIDWGNRPVVINDRSAVRIDGFKKGRLEAIIDGQERFDADNCIEVRKGRGVTFLRTKRALNKLVKLQGRVY
jgi:NAD+ kinase